MNNDPTEALSALKAEWDSLQPLSPENERRFWQKLKLEWNYHSNHIEGNTLTYGETKLLLLHGQTHGSHDLRQFEEMKAHDVGIEHLRTLAKDQHRSLSAGDVRNLNLLLLKEPFRKEARTPDGAPTTKEIVPGEYKTSPNNVITATGELFEFAPPSEVSSRMQDLLDWLGGVIADPAIDVIEIIAKLHYDFVLIHPFDDGNGRVARMLVNFVLLKRGYPPLIVPSDEKREYLNNLRLADAGDSRPFREYLEKCLREALKLGIQAAKGQSLDAPGDIEKQIALFIREQDHNKERVRPRSDAAIRYIFSNGLHELFSLASEKLKIFEPLFVRSRQTAAPGVPGVTDPLAVLDRLVPHRFLQNNYFAISFRFEGYRGEAHTPFPIDAGLRVEFGDFSYTISTNGTQTHKKLYSEPLLQEEATSIIEGLLKNTFERIQKAVQKKR